MPEYLVRTTDHKYVVYTSLVATVTKYRINATRFKDLNKAKAVANHSSLYYGLKFKVEKL